MDIVPPNSTTLGELNSENLSEESLRRRRNRKPLSCNVCRKRKVKCDRQRPFCNVCVKYNVKHLCQYTAEDEEGRPEKKKKKVSKEQHSQLQQQPTPSLGTPPAGMVLPVPNTVHSNTGITYPRNHSYNGQMATMLNPIPHRSAAIPPATHTNNMLPSLKTFDQQRAEQSVRPAPSSQISSGPIQNELESLKDKIRQIEASIAIAGFSGQPIYNSHQTSVASSPLTHHTSPHGSIDSSSTGRNPQQMHFSNPELQSTLDPNETLNFHSGYIPMHFKESRVVNHGPLAWITMVKKDPYLKQMWGRVLKLKKKKKIFPNDSCMCYRGDQEKPEKTASDSSAQKGKQDPDNEFRDRMLENEGITDLQPYKKPKPDQKEEGRSKETLPLGVVNKQETELTTIEHIEKCLPNRKALWMFVDRFFLWVYPFMPYLDQQTFISDIEKIVGPRSDVEEKIESISLVRRLDFATVGTLLLVLRFASLSLMANFDNAYSEFMLTEDEKYLLQFPVGVDVTVVAQLCLNQFRLLRRCTLGIFQCALYMRLYHKYAPEDGDGGDGGDSQIFTGMLIQMGTSMGLNRDPENFEPMVINPRISNLWRKIWYCLLSFDFFQSFALGNPQTSRSSFYDSKLPNYSEETSNTVNFEVEAEVIESIHRRFTLELKLKELAQKALDLKNPPKIVDLLKMLSNLREHMYTEYGSLRKIMMQPTDNNHVRNIQKVKKIIEYCEANLLIHPVYYHIFLAFEQKDNNEVCTYLVKVILREIMQVVSNFFDLLKTSYKFVGRGFDTILTPCLEMSMHKTLQFQFSLYVRCGNLKYKNAGSPEVRLLMDKFLNELVQNVRYYLKGLQVVSKKYYYAWRMSKAQHFILKMLEDLQTYLQQNVFDASEMPEKNAIGRFTAQDFQEMVDIINIQEFLKQQAREQGSFTDMFINSSTSSTGSENTLEDDPSSDSVWLQMLQKQTEDLNAHFGAQNENEHMFGFDVSNEFLKNSDIDFEQIFGEESIEVPVGAFGDLPFNMSWNNPNLSSI